MGAGNYTARWMQAGNLVMTTPSGDHDDVREQAWDALKNLLASSLVDKLGMEPARWSLESASFDPAFSLVARTDLVEVGMHDHGGDLLVGIVPADDLLSMTLDYADRRAAIATRFGRSGEDLSNASTELATHVGDFVRSVMQSAGLVPRFRLDAWTSRAWSDRSAEDLLLEQQGLEQVIDQEHWFLQTGVPVEAVVGQDPIRRSIVEMAASDPDECGFSVVTFAYDAAKGDLVAFDAVNGSRIHGAPHAGPDLRAHLAAKHPGPAGGVFELEADEPVLAFMEEVARIQVGRRRDWHLPILAAEFEEIVGRPVEVTYGDDVHTFATPTAPTP